MSISKKIGATCALLLALSFNSALATKYVVDSQNSVVSFATIKKQYVVESATFNHITGHIAPSGLAEIAIDIASISTQNDIKDKRLQTLFFQVMDFPKITIAATIDRLVLGDFEYSKQLTLQATLGFYGHKKLIELNVLVAKLADERLLITSMRPVIIRASDYGIPAKNLINLAKTVGGFAISDTVAVNFVLSFQKK